MLSTRPTPTVVIVGAGHAGGTLAGMLRQQKFTGRILLCGSETDPPYHRPPLSKKFADDDHVQWLKPEQFYADNDIDLRLGDPVIEFNRRDRTVTTMSGSVMAYTTVVLATGASPRTLPLPGSDLDGVLTLRTLADAARVRDSVAAGSPIAIVGGGYVGLEVAASARARGCAVTVIEREDRVLSRVASAEFAAALTSFHRRRGTSIVTGAQIREITGTAGRAEAVVLDSGAVVPCDLVLIGVGAIPNDSLAREAGIDCSAGIVVDGCARTNDPHVMAIGDVTYRMHDTVRRMVRLESIPSAVEQAKHAAAVIIDAVPPPHEVPWFWSDQFDLKMKMAGMLAPDTRAVLRGDSGGSSFALFHLDSDDVPVAVETVNAPAEFMAGKKYIGNRTGMNPTALADLAVTMHDVVR